MYNGVICGTANPLLVDLAFLQIHTHRPFTQMLKIPCTVKDVSGFPVPSRDVTGQNLPGRELFFELFPARKSLVSDIPAGKKAYGILYIYFSWRDDRWKQRHTYELTHTHAQ